MESLSPIFVLLTLVVAIVAAIGVWRPRRATDTALAERLAEAERRLRDDLQRLRDSMEKSLREQQSAQAEATLQLSERLSNSLRERFEVFTGTLNDIRERFNTNQAEARKELAESLQASRKELSETLASHQKSLKELQDQLAARLESANTAQGEFFKETQKTLAESLDKLRADNEQRLEKIRMTVDEKLQKTLNDRLSDSFKQVSERLELVHKGLGEMQQLATGVGDLKRVLTNVRSRGTYGEVQLRGLLEQVMLPSQYMENVPTIPGSNDRIEFAIRLPGKNKDDAPVLLPIDAKFPTEDYQRLMSAYESGDTVGVEETRKALGTRILQEARKIREKYIHAPETTDFALLFLPTEGLFAEVLRLDGVAERIQRESHIILVGPTTLYAVLNSLQMGFRTLAIEQRSSEVWKVLAAVKTEFEKFGKALEEARRSIELAGNKINTLAGTRARAMQRSLRNLEALPEEEAQRLLPVFPVDTEGNATDEGELN
jgi:DNA recombination protein RmuC